jgi:hypothetical protein
MSPVVERQNEAPPAATGWENGLALAKTRQAN